MVDNKIDVKKILTPNPKEYHRLAEKFRGDPELQPYNEKEKVIKLVAPKGRVFYMDEADRIILLQRFRGISYQVISDSLILAAVIDISWQACQRRFNRIMDFFDYEIYMETTVSLKEHKESLRTFKGQKSD